MVEIVVFDQKYSKEFKALNLEWLDKFGLTEEADLRMLNDPQKEIIEPGGWVFLAMDKETVIGSAALIKEENDSFELAKMVVSPEFRGKGISKLLIDQCFSTARENGARRIFLVSNSQLKTALSLYEKYGFKYIPVTNAHYVTADIMMEILL